MQCARRRAVAKEDCRRESGGKLGGFLSESGDIGETRNVPRVASGQNSTNNNRRAKSAGQRIRAISVRETGMAPPRAAAATGRSRGQRIAESHVIKPDSGTLSQLSKGEAGTISLIASSMCGTRCGTFPKRHGFAKINPLTAVVLPRKPVTGGAAKTSRQQRVGRLDQFAEPGSAPSTWVSVRGRKFLRPQSVLSTEGINVTTEVLAAIVAA